MCLRPGGFLFSVDAAPPGGGKNGKKQPADCEKKQYFVNFYVLHKFYGEFRVKLKQRVSRLQKIVETLQKEKAAR